MLYFFVCFILVVRGFCHFQFLKFQDSWGFPGFCFRPAPALHTGSKPFNKRAILLTAPRKGQGQVGRNEFTSIYRVTIDLSSIFHDFYGKAI